MNPGIPPPRTDAPIGKQKPDELDVLVGANLRLYRKAANVGLDKLGAAIGVTYQQLQKYERGANRISASTLLRLALALDIRVEDFYHGAPGYLPEASMPLLDPVLARRLARIAAKNPLVFQRVNDLVVAIDAQASGMAP